MRLSPARIAALYLAKSNEAWLPDYIGSRSDVVSATLNNIKVINNQPQWHSAKPQQIAGGLIYHMLKDAADIADDARAIFRILDRNAGLVAGGDLWRYAEQAYHAFVRGGVPSDKKKQALLIGMFGVELLQRTKQLGRAQAVNSYFVRKYKHELDSMQIGRQEESSPSEVLRTTIDAEMKREVARVVKHLGNNPQKALAFIVSVLSEANANTLAQQVGALGQLEPLSDKEEVAAQNIAGSVQYQVEKAAAFGLAFLEAINASELASQYQKIVLKVGKSLGWFTTRFAGDAYKGNPDGQGIYPNEIDHGYTEPLAGGTDVMRRLQNQFRHEQGRDQRPESPRLAAGPSAGTIEVSVQPDRMYFTARRLFGSVKFKELNSVGVSFVESMIAFVQTFKESAASAGVVPGWQTAQASEDVARLDEVLVSGFAPGGFMEVRASIFVTGNFTDEDAAWRILNASAKKHGFKLK